MTLVAPTGRELYITRGDDFLKPWGAVEEPVNEDDTAGGRAIRKLVIVNGSTTATALDGDFSTFDDEKKLAVADGVGVTDGTTMSFVDEHTIELSTPATATRSNVLAFARPVNCTAYDGLHLAQIRRRPVPRTGPVPPADATILVDYARSQVGIFWFVISKLVTRGLGNHWGWDWQVDGPEGLSTWLDGRIVLRKDYSRE